MPIPHGHLLLSAKSLEWKQIYDLLESRLGNDPIPNLQLLHLGFSCISVEWMIGSSIQSAVLQLRFGNDGHPISLSKAGNRHVAGCNISQRFYIGSKHDAATDRTPASCPA